jgi:hypothetical protein
MIRRRTWTGILLAIGLSAATCLWAGNDTPIIIGDGSLYIHSEIPWSHYTTDGTAKVHPEAAKAITNVEIVMPNNGKTVDCGRKRCTISIRYGATDIVFASGANGKGLRFTTDHSTFHAGSDEKEILHNDTGSKISSVTVTRGRQILFRETAHGGTKVTIHYE